MYNIFEQLEQCELFKGFDKLKIQKILKNSYYEVVKYTKGEIIALEGDEIKALGVVLSGDVDVKKLYETGKMLQVKKLGIGDLIGNATVFSDSNYYPSTIISSNDSNILFISQKDIVYMCMNNRQFFSNFVRSLSNQIVYLSEKVKFISSGTIRKKVINYLLMEYRKNRTLKIELSMTRKKMAEFFGVTRPALSKEMIIMKKEHLIDYKDNIIEIIDLNKLEEELEK